MRESKQKDSPVSNLSGEELKLNKGLRSKQLTRKDKDRLMNSSRQWEEQRLNSKRNCGWRKKRNKIVKELSWSRNDNMNRNREGDKRRLDRLTESSKRLRNGFSRNLNEEGYRSRKALDGLKWKDSRRRRKWRKCFVQKKSNSKRFRSNWGRNNSVNCEKRLRRKSLNNRKEMQRRRMRKPKKDARRCKKCERPSSICKSNRLRPKWEERH